MVKSSQLNTMETFLSGFRIKRDGKVYTLQDDEEQAMIYLREICELNDEQLDFFGVSSSNK